MKVWNKISDFAGVTAGILIVAMWLLMTAEVVARNVFHSPILGASEIAIYLYVSAVYFGFSYAQKAGAHIRVELLYEKLGEGAKKIDDIIVSFVCVVLFLCFSIFLWNAFIESFRIREIYLSAMKMPVYLLRFMISTGATLILIQVTVELICAVRGLVSYIRDGKAQEVTR